MARIINTQNGKRLEIEDKCFNSGGQGGIHKILSRGYESYIAKIYHDINKAQASERKLLHMVQFSPCKTAPLIIRQSLAWPESALYQNGRFAGYIMPKAKNAIELTELITPKSPHHRNGMDWKKFDISNTESIRNRLIMCYNISRAVDLLHNSGMYTLVDLKPDNIMVSKQGIITIIDLDSIQVTDSNGILYFNADVCTEEYAPPEFLNKKIVPKSMKIAQSWDIFSFVVICYKILFAIHPFQASHDKYSTITELIQNGYFVHGRKKNNLCVIPHIHKGFFKLPQSTQELFFRTFEDGHNNPTTRPNLSEWVTTFSDLILSKKVVNNTGHYSENYRYLNRKMPKVSSPNIQVNKLYNKDDVELRWMTLNTVGCELNGKNIGLKGSIIVPLQNKNYIFNIISQDGKQLSKKVSIKVPKPKIKNFSISNISLNQGVLKWSVSNAIKVTLNSVNVLMKDKQNIDLYLPHYTLIAENKIGQSAKKDLINPIWGAYNNLKIMHSNNNIRHLDSIINQNNHIQFNERIQNKKYVINSKF